ncbi:hypothetical protein D7W82_27675 [Corallococcus sp. CA049B]|uniref:hypothetical protein n=1 Tax=Corallococcus sp. CA049B TaxID=2316730 RepID=UPI000EA36C5A|nr:hypothetical protein [Corallococcus sp. CA049B]RKG81694.1 hypothetical protein D7W82_27675 [Corallococcus sp. CA049B]
MEQIGQGLDASDPIVGDWHYSSQYNMAVYTNGDAIETTSDGGCWAIGDVVFKDITLVSVSGTTRTYSAYRDGDGHCGSPFTGPVTVTVKPTTKPGATYELIEYYGTWYR